MDRPFSPGIRVHKLPDSGAPLQTVCTGVVSGSEAKRPDGESCGITLGKKAPDGERKRPEPGPEAAAPVNPADPGHVIPACR